MAGKPIVVNRIDLSVEGVAETIADLERIAAETGPTFERVIQEGLGRVAQEVRMNLTGRVLHVRSGRLLRSLTDPKVVRQERNLEGEVAVTDYKGRFHEFGATRHAGETRLRRGNVFRFIGREGTPVFARSITQQGGQLVARPFLAPAFASQKERIEEDLRVNLDRVIR